VNYEDLLRVEYKLDLIIEAMQDKGIMMPSSYLPPMSGVAGDKCPACGQQIVLKTDYATEEITRHCGCKLPTTIVSGISALIRTKEEDHAHRRTDEETVPAEPEEGGAGDGGRQDPAGPGGQQNR